MKVLVDACVLQDGVTTEPATRSETVQWGGRQFSVEVPALRSKARPQGWLGRQIAALGHIATAALNGRLELFLAAEIRHEVWGAPPDAVRRGPTHVFHGVQFSRAPDPLEYGRVVLAAFDPPGAGAARLREFVRGLGDSQLCALVTALGPNKTVDAFHLMTAARAGLDAFLTIDRKLINSVRRARSVTLRVAVVSPTELLALLKRLARR